MTWWMVAGGVAAAVVAAVQWLRTHLLVVTVRGLSMAPTYQPGDRVLVRRRPPRRVRAGQIVVADLPESVRPLPAGLRPDEVLRQRRVIKRVVAVAGEVTPAGVGDAPARVPAGAMVLLGDNPLASGDSRQYGAVPLDAVVGVVLRKMGGSAAPVTVSR
jgi:signal peptidase I